ncbi:MAG: hypothetical protein EZS28_015286 [Streblomastix strix]|uniref:Uncharacterized protein n=1 Tax=Streblomastix strix TaxID=222440 RepID=A0A5J4W3T4_9EUKA|nr:MAG: hypothetical protein EZS28_015286 [Streblomastix strix]
MEEINDALIQDCQALTSSNPESTGYGGGIFIGVGGIFIPSTQKLDLKGMKIYGNSASKAGQSLYAVMSELKDWCEYGLDSDTSLGNNTFDCGEVSFPCKTIEYTIQEISVKKGGQNTVFIEEKNIGISQNGFDLMYTLQLNKSGSYTNIIKIMKQLYGTPSEMPGNAEIKVLKNNDDNKENGKQGWISVFEGLQLHLYGLNIIMDNSQLLIPIIYIQDSDSFLELNTITFSEIKLSPTTESKGIIHINVDNSQFIASYCSFKNIDISSKGGNVIRILNSGSYPITSTIKGCQFNNISNIGDSNG